MCTCPLPARRIAGGGIEFLQRAEKARFFSNATATLQIPCGQCYECRLKRSREWAIRCVHESKSHKDNCFITLSYRDMPAGASLNYSDFQKFMRRLRKAWPNDTIRFYMCGEYGETNPATKRVDGGLYRPHFHACLFGFNFPDREPLRLIDNPGLYKSKQLEVLWPHGFHSIGEVTFESAAYIARYCVQKVNGAKAMWHYMYVDPDTGEISWRNPEFNHMSLKPGIGRDWFEKYHPEVYASDSVIIRGKETKPPRYYDKKFAEIDEAAFDAVSDKREREGKSRAADHTDSRNEVRDVVVRARSSTLKRD